MRAITVLQVVIYIDAITIDGIDNLMLSLPCYDVAIDCRDTNENNDERIVVINVLGCSYPSADERMMLRNTVRNACRTWHTY
jgi:hypothetical protein